MRFLLAVGAGRRGKSPFNVYAVRARARGSTAVYNLQWPGADRPSRAERSRRAAEQGGVRGATVGTMLLKASGRHIYRLETNRGDVPVALPPATTPLHTTDIAHKSTTQAAASLPPRFRIAWSPRLERIVWGLRGITRWYQAEAVLFSLVCQK